jgi:GNAT superfamily N-acetyltransferase
MPHLVNASQAQVEAVYRESHAIWGGGLNFEQYFGLWREVSSLPWTRKHAAFRVWLGDDGELLSSLKLYRPLIQLFGRTERATVLGAIFTPRAMRGRGHASEMLQAVIEACRCRGERLALLFSDIGTTFYEAAGFRPLPAEEHWGRLRRPRRALPGGWELRRPESGDLPAIRRAHDAFTAERSLAFIRDEEHWRFLEERSAGYFARLRDPAVRQCCRVAVDNGRFAGYLITVEGRGEWNVREIGAVGGDARRMAVILSLGAHEARMSGLRHFYGWLPPDVVAELDDWPIRSRLRRKAEPMIRLFDETVNPGRLGTVRAAYLPYQDQF